MNRESWYLVAVVILIILALGTLIVVASDDDEGNVDFGPTPTVPQLETPLDDAEGGQDTDIETTPETEPSDANTGS